MGKKRKYNDANVSYLCESAEVGNATELTSNECVNLRLSKKNKKKDYNLIVDSSLNKTCDSYRTDLKSFTPNLKKGKHKTIDKNDNCETLDKSNITIDFKGPGKHNFKKSKRREKIKNMLDKNDKDSSISFSNQILDFEFEDNINVKPKKHKDGKKVYVEESSQFCENIDKTNSSNNIDNYSVDNESKLPKENKKHKRYKQKNNKCDISKLKYEDIDNFCTKKVRKKSRKEGKCFKSVEEACEDEKKTIGLKHEESKNTLSVKDLISDMSELIKFVKKDNKFCVKECQNNILNDEMVTAEKNKKGKEKNLSELNSKIDDFGFKIDGYCRENTDSISTSTSDTQNISYNKKHEDKCFDNFECTFSKSSKKKTKHKSKNVTNHDSIIENSKDQYSTTKETLFREENISAGEDLNRDIFASSKFPLDHVKTSTVFFKPLLLNQESKNKTKISKKRKKINFISEKDFNKSYNEGESLNLNLDNELEAVSQKKKRHRDKTSKTNDICSGEPCLKPDFKLRSSSSKKKRKDREGSTTFLNHGCDLNITGKASIKTSNHKQETIQKSLWINEQKIIDLEKNWNTNISEKRKKSNNSDSTSTNNVSKKYFENVAQGNLYKTSENVHNVIESCSRRIKKKHSAFALDSSIILGNQKDRSVLNEENMGPDTKMLSLTLHIKKHRKSKKHKKDVPSNKVICETKKNYSPQSNRTQDNQLQFSSNKSKSKVKITRDARNVSNQEMFHPIEDAIVSNVDKRSIDPVKNLYDNDPESDKNLSIKEIIENSHNSSTEFDFEEDGVDFEIPALHRYETICSITEQKKNEMISEGVNILYSKFTNTEDEIILNNYKEFALKYKISDPFSLLGIGNYKKNLILLKFIRAKHFYVRLGKGLWNRTLPSIYKRARKLLHPYKKSEKIDECGISSLKWMQKTIGNKWQKMADTVGDCSDKCLQTYRWHEKNISKGKWVAKEESQLIKAIKKVTGSSDISSNSVNKISWEQVAAHVPSRNFSQCRWYWANHLAWQDSSQKQKWTKFCNVKLISILCKEWDVLDASFIDWKKVHESFKNEAPSPAYLQKRWLNMKYRIPKHKNMNFKDILEQLCKKYNITNGNV